MPTFGSSGATGRLRVDADAVESIAGLAAVTGPASVPDLMLELCHEWSPSRSEPTCWVWRSSEMPLVSAQVSSYADRSAEYAGVYIPADWRPAGA